MQERGAGAPLVFDQVILLSLCSYPAPPPPPGSPILSHHKASVQAVGWPPIGGQKIRGTAFAAPPTAHNTPGAG